MTELLFIVTEQPQGGYVAQAAGSDLATSGATRDELLRNLKQVVVGRFDGRPDAPKLIHLHYVRDETIAMDAPAEQIPDERYPLRGKPYRYDDPFSPVGLEDWEALK